MRVTEFMINDYVYSTFADKPCKITKLEIFPSEYGMCEVDGVVGKKDINSLTPIPLTPEILEKNGWGCYNTYQKYSNSNVSFELRRNKDGGFVIEVDGYEYGHGAFTLISYVHELQHALRLCGIEREVKL